MINDPRALIADLEFCNKNPGTPLSDANVLALLGINESFKHEHLRADMGSFFGIRVEEKNLSMSGGDASITGPMTINGGGIWVGDTPIDLMCFGAVALGPLVHAALTARAGLATARKGFLKNTDFISENNVRNMTRAHDAERELTDAKVRIRELEAALAEATKGNDK